LKGVLVKVEPALQQRLLELQAVDSRLAQVDHQRRNLPQLAVISELDASLAALGDRIIAAETEVTDLQRAQTKAETDVEQVRARSERDQELLNSGRITAPKELENLQHEVASLGRRQSELEDVELEVMEQLEGAREYLAGLTAERELLVARRSVAVEERDAAFAKADAESADLRADRADIAPGIPADLSALYEKLRADNAGIGAAALRQRRCEGCRMELTPIDLGRIREAPEDEVLRCEECRRILVRTAESGL
jgi:predicted  nucleic acid-binding Zn-ribbon protein